VRGVVLHNDDIAPPALLNDWLRGRELPHSIVRVWEEGVPTDPREFGWIVALGASDSATQTEPAWIPNEIDLLRRAVDADVPVLGICWGGQALSVALGGEISVARPPAWGWLEVETESPRIVSRGPWLHFNHEIFTVPDGAIRLASSPAGPGAFRVGPHLGLQFHPEVTPPIVDRWAADEKPTLAELGIDRAQLRAEGERLAGAAKQRAFELFDAWRSLNAAGA
jgi:GMP synthase-like glutamine amidotransferase